MNEHTITHKGPFSECSCGWSVIGARSSVAMSDAGISLVEIDHETMCSMHLDWANHEAISERYDRPYRTQIAPGIAYTGD